MLHSEVINQIQSNAKLNLVGVRMASKSIPTASNIHSMFKSTHTERTRRRKLSLMFVIYSLIFIAFALRE